MATKLKTLERRKAIWGYVFILPNLIGFLLFTIIPVIFSFIISFTDWNVVSNKVKFIGFENYSTLFNDMVFLKSMMNSFYFALLTVTTGIGAALLLAVALNREVRGIWVYRTFVFLPVVTSLVAVSLVWSLLYNDDFGLFNIILTHLGLPRVGWLTDPKAAMVSIAIMSVWKGLGYNMTIYLAALQGVPSDLYEASSLDGASKTQQFFHITIPLLRPATFFVTIMAIIAALQTFDQVYIMTQGGPADATTTIVMYLYNNAFKYLKLGYASAMAYVLFMIILLISVIQYSISKRTSEV
jgi:multiple sugar transport system permease protein